MKEYYNIDKVKQLLELPTSILQEFVENPSKRLTNKDGDKYYYKYVKKILKDIIKCGNGKSVVYNHKENNRQYAELGAQGLPSHIKTIILDKDYKDYDLKNAHFNILLKLCDKHSISCNHLRDYATDRANILKREGFKKQDAIIWLYMDKPKPRYENRWIINFVNELRTIKNNLLIKLNIKVETPNKKHNPISSLISKVLCKEEDEILEKVLAHYNLEDAIKMFDGFMTREEIDLDELHELTNYEYDIKIHEEVEIPKNIKQEAEGLVIDWADIYYKKNKQDWRINKYDRGYELYHFHKKSGFWNRVSPPYEELRSDIRNGGMLEYLQSSVFLEDYQSKDLSNLEPFIESFINKNSTIGNLTSIVYDRLIYDWEENVEFDNLDYIINFKNLCYDLNKMEFVERERNHYSTLSARYLDERDEKGVEEIKNIIESIHPNKEDRFTYLQLLCNGLSGKALEKCVFCNGVGANGKGLLHGGLMRSLLGSYYYTGDNKTLIERSNGANQSLANLSNKRFVVYEEPDENTPINFNMIKTMTGGKIINARGLYEKNDQTRLALTLFIECNKKPNLSGDTGNSMVRRLLDIKFPSCFKEETDPTFNKDIHKKADPRLKDNDKLEELSSQLFYYLIDFMKMKENKLNYKNLDIIKVSNDIRLRSKQYIDSNNTILELINEVCDPIETTKINDDTLKVTDLYNLIRTTDTWILSTNKFKKEWGKNKFMKELKDKEHYQIKEQHRYLYILNYKKKEIKKDSDDDDDDNDIDENKIDKLNKNVMNEEEDSED